MNLRTPGAVLLISCYELGHQPLCTALSLGFLQRAGFAPAALDIAVEQFDTDRIAQARFIGISVPMHTALRLGVRVAERIREINPTAIVCFYGLYAALNADYLLEHGADYCIGGEVEEPLVALVVALETSNGKAPSPLPLSPEYRGEGEKGKAPSPLPLSPEYRGEGEKGKAPSPLPLSPEYRGEGEKGLPSPLYSGERGRGEGGVDVAGVTGRGAVARPFLKRLPFALPLRESLPPLQQYARLEHRGERRVVGYVEASRGCLHLCTHCPIPPVYEGRFFIIPEAIVLTDIRQQVAAGATHITFGDPDFLNGPGHALSVVRAMHAEFPDLTFDITTKVEHILQRGGVLPELGQLGCLFLISAVESTSDTVLGILEKNHTRADIEEAIRRVRAAGIAPRPTWVAFTPWTSLGDYLDMLAFIEANGLIDNVDPVQYTIRLLIPPGSYLLNRPETKPHLGPLDQASFSYKWAHPDPHMDRLQKKVSALVEKDVAAGADPAATFFRVWSLAAGREAGAVMPVLAPDRERAPRLSEPWFC